MSDQDVADTKYPLRRTLQDQTVSRRNTVPGMRGRWWKEPILLSAFIQYAHRGRGLSLHNSENGIARDVRT